MNGLAPLERHGPVIAPPPRHDDLIYDIGMDVCQDTNFYLSKGFRVVAVDANPASCRAAETRYRDEIARGQLSVLNRAISETREPLTFYVCESFSSWSTASTKLRDQWSRQGAVFAQIEVPGITTEDLLVEHGVPYYAKIDIEGFDLVCLKGFKGPKIKPAWVSVEVDFYALDDLFSCLRGLGYRRFAVVGQSSIPTQRPPTPALEGRYVDYPFTSGCSGLFGKELPATWVDEKEARRQLAQIVSHYRLFGLLNRVAGAPFLKNKVEKIRQATAPLACDWYDIHAVP